MAEVDDYGNYIPETVEILNFKRDTGTTHSDMYQGEKATNDVIINDVTLSEGQIADLENIYRIKPLPGEYWYDARSGLYGVVGFPAYSFMQPDHNLGTLDLSASNGDTSVTVNGRELPQSEWAVWSYIIGSWIQPGAYWLDDNGNAGYKGNPIPTINLYVAHSKMLTREKAGAAKIFDLHDLARETMTRVTKEVM